MLARIPLMLIALLLCFSLLGQDEEPPKEVVLNQTETKDFSRKAMVNQGNPQVALARGGLFYVSNPSPTYEVDAELLYHNPEWQSGRATLLGEENVKLQARYQVLNQKFEVLYEGERYDMDSERLMSIVIGEDEFIFLPDPLLKKRGRIVHQVHFRNAQYQLLEQHHAQWQDPPERNMFDTRANHRTLRRSSATVLRIENQFHHVRNGKDFFKILGLSKKGSAARYAKREGLKLQNPEDMARLLEYLATQQGR